MAALQEIERTERVLKSLWRERCQATPGWIEQYQVLETQSEQVRRTALILLKNLWASNLAANRKNGTEKGEPRFPPQKGPHSRACPLQNVGLSQPRSILQYSYRRSDQDTLEAVLSIAQPRDPSLGL